MFKKMLALSAILTVSCIAFAQQNEKVVAIKKTLEHIQEQKKTIVTEMQQAITFGKKVESHFQGLFQDNYNSIKEKCLILLSTIVASSEYNTTIEQVTDIQLTGIVEEGMNLDDIAIDPSDFPLEQKIQSALLVEAFDEKTEQLFNAFYIIIAITHGSKTLIKKLSFVEMQLTEQLQKAEITK